MTGRPLISLRGVRKSYGDHFELGPLELEVQAGCVVAVVGPNGSGKSTLFGMLMNLIQPDSGEVRLFGCSYPKDEVAIKQRVGYVPEFSVGYDGMRVKDLAEFVSYWYSKWDQRLYRELVGPLDIEPDTPFGHLSKGVQRRLSFALALATGAELLLLDEPTAGVDPLARKEMLEEDIPRFMEAGNKSRNRAVVFSTHVVEEVRRVADYVAVLVDGKLLGFYEKDTLLERWKTLVVDREPEGDIAGAVEVVVGGTLTRIVSDSPEETEEALATENIRIVRKETMDLEEILSRLMRKKREPGRREKSLSRSRS
jgi:ABC-2 type transport system ATP-binding protein